jgi:hypothetical protein
MVTAVAAEVPFVRPSISPVTVPPNGATFMQLVQLNEKSKFKAWPGDGNKPNEATAAIRPNNFDFMDVPPPKKCQPLDD